jgi:hypothetical protein
MRSQDRDTRRDKVVSRTADTTSERERGTKQMNREDIIALCEEAMSDLEYNNEEETIAYKNLCEIRASQVNKNEVRV